MDDHLRSMTERLRENISQTDVRRRELSAIALKGDAKVSCLLPTYSRRDNSCRLSCVSCLKLVESFLSDNVVVEGTKGTAQLFVGNSCRI